MVAASLMTIGVVMLASTEAMLDQSLVERLSLETPFARQVAVAIGSCLVMVVCSRIGPGVFRWRRNSLLQPAVWVFLASLVLLALVWVRDLGVTSHGRSRWLTIGPIGFQPSDVAKLALVIFLAAVLSRRSGSSTFADAKDGAHRHVRPGVFWPIVGIGAVCLMVGWEDFGSAVLLLTVGAAMLFVGGCRFLSLVAWAVPAAGAFAYLLVSHPYRLERLLAFLNLWEDPRGRGYHAIQSLAAIASGGWTGCGLGAGLAKFGYLPESRTDFIFAVICEETGVLGGGLVIGLFVVLVCLGMRAMFLVDRSDGGFLRLFAFGVTVMVGLQAVMNIAVVTVVAPTKGIGLPFVSAGGTSLLCFSVAIGLLAGVPGKSVRRVVCSELASETTYDGRLIAEGA